MSTGTPDHRDDRGNAWGHRLRAIEGNFGRLVWQCTNCEKRRTKKQFFRTVDCN